MIVPAWNESGSIAQVVLNIKRTHPDFDVVVIDDGSTDATLRAIPSEAIVVSLPFNLGIGGAMQAGYRYAAMHGYTVAIQVDADGQHPPSEIHKILEPLHNGTADMVVGSRFLGDTGYRQSPGRMAGIRILGLLIRLFTGQHYTDCTSGFRAVNREVLNAFAHWYPDDYPEPEVILLLNRGGYRVIEVPVNMSQRQAGRSSISLVRGLIYVIKVGVALCLDTIRNPWPKEKIKP